MSIRRKRIFTLLIASVLSVCLFMTLGFQIDVDSILDRYGGSVNTVLSGELTNDLDEAYLLLAAAQAAADSANTALAEAQAAADIANAALAAAIAAGITGPELEVLQLVAADANAALAAAQASADGANTALAEAQKAYDESAATLETGGEGSGAGKYFHVITNSNNGGSIDIEGNNQGVEGDTFSFSFTSEDGYYLAWLRVGNTKIYSSEELTAYSGTFNKNLTIHAHFKKDKDSNDTLGEEDAAITGDGDGDGPDDDITTMSGENNNGNGQGKDKDKKDKDKDKGDKDKKNNGKK
ncbi:MAG: hypothetical protein JW997_04920 [Actinobacteria bacterium]|nr:hypothetical protein [Actinomycetota bacterium]